MKTFKRLLPFLALAAIFILWDLLMDWLMPMLKQSAFFHGLMVFAGAATIPLWLLLTTSTDQRPFPPDARYPRPLTRLFLLSISTGLALLGLSFWFPVLKTAAMVAAGIVLVSSILLMFLLHRAEKKQSAKTAQ